MGNQQTSVAQYRTNSQYKMIAALTVLTSIMSLGTSSIYVNNYMTRKNVLFGQILTTEEKNFIITSLVVCILSLLASLGLLIFKYKNRPRYCVPKLQDGNLIRPTTQGDVDSNKAVGKDGSVCNSLHICETNEEQIENDKITINTNKICVPHYYGTTSLIIGNMIISILGILMCSVLLADISINRRLNHTTNPSSYTLFVMALIFAVISAQVPLLMFTYALATIRTGGVATITQEKIVQVVGPPGSTYAPPPPATTSNYSYSGLSPSSLSGSLGSSSFSGSSSSDLSNLGLSSSDLASLGLSSDLSKSDYGIDPLLLSSSTKDKMI